MHEQDSEMKPCPPGKPGILDMVNQQLGLPTSKDEEITRLREKVSDLHAECQEKDNQIEEIQTLLERKKGDTQKLNSRLHDLSNNYAALAKQREEAIQSNKTLLLEGQSLEDQLRAAKSKAAKDNADVVPLADVVPIKDLIHKGVPKDVILQITRPGGTVGAEVRRSWLNTCPPFELNKEIYVETVPEWAVALANNRDAGDKTAKLVTDICKTIEAVILEASSTGKIENHSLPGIYWGSRRGELSMMLRTNQFWKKSGITTYPASVTVDKLLKNHWFINSSSWTRLAKSFGKVEKLLQGVDNAIKESISSAAYEPHDWIRKHESAGECRLSSFFFWPGFTPSRCVELALTRI